MHTSIFRPSTTVPWRRSRARSASVLLANVTKPNPYMQDRQNMHYQPAVNVSPGCSLQTGIGCWLQRTWPKRLAAHKDTIHRMVIKKKKSNGLCLRNVQQKWEVLAAKGVPYSQWPKFNWAILEWPHGGVPLQEKNRVLIANFMIPIELMHLEK